MIGVDLKSPIDFGHKTFTDSLKGSANVHRANSFLTTDRLSSQKTIRQMRSKISWQPSNKEFFLFRSIPLYGFCPDNLSPESSRHRKLSSSNAVETLPLRNTRECFTQHIGKCERTSRLENLCRLRTDFDRQSPNTLRQRRLRHSVGPRSLRPGFNHHRFMSFTVSMGKISQAQSCGQNSHADGLKRLYTHVYPHYRRKSPRCQYPRRTDFGAGGHLHYGSWLPRLRSSLYLHSKSLHVYHQGQKQFRLSPSLLSQSRQGYWFAMRSNDNAQWLLHIAGLSRCSSSNRLFRHRDKQEVHLSNKQLWTASFDNRSALQVPLADRNIFQMDQTIPANQDVLRNFRECREDSNLDSHQHLRFGRNRQERTQNRAEFGRNLANSQHCPFRESLYDTSTYEKCFAK